MLNKEEIRKELQFKHGVQINPNDPIFLALWLNEVVLDHYIDRVDKKNGELQREISAALARHTIEARELGGEIITKASNYVAEQARSAISSANADASIKIRQEIAEAVAASRNAVESANTAASSRATALVAAGAAIIAAVLAFVALIVVLMK